MKKKISIIVLIVGIISIMSGIVLMAFNKNEKTKKMDDIKTSIVNDYEKFKTKIETFSTERTSVYESLNKINYTMQLGYNYNTLINEYKNYEDTLKEIDKISVDLKKNCLENKFEEKDINNKVEAFIINYEQAVNYFINDVNTFNEEVKKYNELIGASQTTNNYQILDEYKSSYSDYVDINGDGIYNGVENK